MPACRALLTVTCLPFLAGRPYPFPFSSLPSCLPAVAVSRRRMPAACLPKSRCLPTHPAFLPAYLCRSEPSLPSRPEPPTIPLAAKARLRRRRALPTRGRLPLPANPAYLAYLPTLPAYRASLPNLSSLPGLPIVPTWPTC